MIEKNRGWREAIEKELIGQTVLTKHGGNKLYTIIRICYDETPEDKFYLRKEKKEVTYFQYFMERYGLKVRNLTQPLLEVMPNGKLKWFVKMVPEFAFPTGLDDAMR